MLGLMLALPLALSAAYKSLSGGESVKIVNATDYLGNAFYYSIFSPLGLQLLGKKTGVTLFSNATLPFVVAWSSTTATKLPVPMHKQAYSFDVLLLRNDSTAMLDIPQLDYISGVQSLLAPGESWNLTAPVIGTIAKFNYSKMIGSDAYNPGFMSMRKGV